MGRAMDVTSVERCGAVTMKLSGIRDADESGMSARRQWRLGAERVGTSPASPLTLDISVGGKFNHCMQIKLFH